MQLFFNPDITTETTQITFDKEESRHIVRVLRKKEGDILQITNGAGFLFSVSITIANDKRCLTTVVKYEEKPNNRDYYLHVAIAPTKNNDRLEWFLEKATEIGIDEITPIICDNSERKIVKIDRLNKIVQAAMKQSLQFTLPKLNDPIKLSEFLKKDVTSKLFIAHCEENIEKKLLKNIADKNENYTILIGPEGDFSSKEIDYALNHNFKPISLGDNRLRTETAGLNVVQSIAFIHQ
ncbi:16S rRNA (uracil(1498)-N(3))-methyltransferase [Tenacibaculum finnmarkense genomovar finnmarkense]|uniref:Ribosomal RNA small subunit methyltransferase E n=2 Tax=Tenacibaculum finnmarkense TaxID=2781243 RepID=A0A2I2MAM8_9FLAO|nr:16S rRNA (uracil(1498)-N(3))-methyltransferase [Tenacibaculum finnmarkense]ALU75368.1 16S rRNA methyltransferase [Tenacibaculum dicentrarchi]MBE7632770.1 16S rRNA (uracil(1498)-N(3))-methyltransferase [Tenacibaculum finnmarkense genomovar ulcerans]MBE7644420.1 16S rRNA (uracil(1498)-N(3))-methyltransferase [Tenacibaculum finnmarkense genomovar ulcerans]MBE7648012.1 16S rRNA (uracil(1498)-N(3))-methyltransferase [Tenacibaculum finnmarkense genomovar ulcerans]MBE7652363.1 16S rRNA (uracil(149